MRTTKQRLVDLMLSPPTVLLLSLVIFSFQFDSKRFTCDDAYISYRYARNIGDGFGPVFNAGERVEGYTNPLWVYLLASGTVIGIRPEILAHALGFAAGAATVALSFFLARSLAGQTRWVVLAPICLAVSHDHAAWSSGGLEMGLFVLLLLGAVYAALREAERSVRPLSAALAALAALTRPEGLLVAAAVAVFGLLAVRDRGLRLGVMALLMAPFLAFRIGYYHQLVPNTLVAKGDIEPLRGLFYVAEFLRSHPGFPIWALFTLLYRERFRWIGILGSAHLLVLVMVGGDFMEFRLVLPISALAICGTPYVLKRARSWLAWPLAVTALVGCSYLSITEYRQLAAPFMIENIEELERNARSWSRIGVFMQAAMKSDERIAVGPAGAIPYYSNLPTIDMLGLCDAWVARYGNVISSAAGHKRVAPPAYLARRDVVWIVGQPDSRRVPDRSEDKISVMMGKDQYLMLRTTLNADSLRRVLRARGYTVVSPDTAEMAIRANRAVKDVLTGWHRLAAGEVESSRRLARSALRHARHLDVKWRWVLREAGILEQTARERIGAVVGESKQWETIESEIPQEWRRPFAQAKARVFPALLDSAKAKE